jgi:hypothetical protein
MRGNGLQAEAYAAAGDVDRMHAGDALLALREVGVAAYVVLGTDGRAEVFADRRALDRARDALRTLVDEPLDRTDEAWSQIVAGYDATAPDPPSAWHLPTPPERPTPPPEPPAPPPAAPTPRPASTGDLNSPASWEDEGHFVPPAAPPVPRGDLVSRLAWGGLIGGPAVLLLSALLTLGLPTEILAVCVGAFVGGLVTLIVRMKDRGSGPDDGAVI